MSYCRSKTDAEDCLQEVFYRALSKTNLLKKHPAPDKWLFTTARLVSLENIRANRKASLREVPIINVEDALQSESFEEVLLEQVYTDYELVLFRSDILENLNAKEKTLYVLRYIEKLNTADIAENLNISYSNTTTRINRLKNKITKLVSKMFESKQKEIQYDSNK